MTTNVVTLLNSDGIIDPKLTDYWAADIWEVKDFPYPEKLGRRLGKAKFDFTLIQNPNIRNQMKYYSYYGLSHEYWLLSSYRNGTYNYLLWVWKFISTYHKNIQSITEMPYQESFQKYKQFLIENNKPLKGSSRNCISRYIGVYNEFYKFWLDFYDDRPEYKKDCWNVEKLGIEFNMSRRDKHINFENIPPVFRELVKEYMYQTLLVQQLITYSTATNIMKKMYLFFDFIVEEHPTWEDLRNMSRIDIERFLFYVRNIEMGGRSYTKNRKPSNRHILECISNVKRLIEYMQRYEWGEAPTIPVKLLIFPEDMPKRKFIRYSDHIKHVPDEIWEQVQQYLHLLEPEIARLIIILEASGFRVSDVCQLNYDSLIRKSDGWWLIGDQRKVRHEKHTVPISEEIVTIIKMQQEYVLSRSKEDDNPNRFLFPVLSGRNKGKAVSQKIVSNALNRLAHKMKILDKDGSIYHFKNHAFRHRYGVTLINNGMNILHVQKLMAHTSPEMTLTYARILDNTLRKEWEKVENAVRLNPHGEVIYADLSEQAEENGLELEWIRHNMDSVRLDHGFCIKSPKLNCDFLEQTLEPPCIKNNCRSFHVNQTFLDYYNSQIIKMESDIELYKKSGRHRSIELIEPKISKYKEIRESISEGTEILGLSKERREYIGSERKKGGPHG
ncbi:tyrosine-type recombinase/integrase [Peribacillus frigoritolerans]|uniref:tyrosine-type recombinase/integrase n=1 Tax=Peribacillus castrilensis TaxID=2897690 RepID=UPI002DCD0D03|nr:tyrosine-type recombinase/integrase [Peribacillus castrilensis]